MNGFEHVWQLKQTPATESMILTAVSGCGQESNRLHPREAGFTYHLVKPLDIRQLEQILGTQVNHAPSH